MHDGKHVQGQNNKRQPLNNSYGPQPDNNIWWVKDILTEISLSRKQNKKNDFQKLYVES